MVSFPNLPANNPALRGQPAARKVLFGGNSRYAVAPVHTRFDALQFFVWDAETDDGTGCPQVIRQGDTLAEVLNGLV